MLENKKHDGIHYSRYIASWRNMGGRFFDEEFKEWLRSEGFSDEEIREVKEMATCGKLELETTAKQFINKEKEMIKKFEDEEKENKINKMQQALDNYAKRNKEMKKRNWGEINLEAENNRKKSIEKAVKNSGLAKAIRNLF